MYQKAEGGPGDEVARRVNPEIQWTLFISTTLYLEQTARSPGHSPKLILSLYLELSLSLTNYLVPCEFEIESIVLSGVKYNGGTVYKFSKNSPTTRSLLRPPCSFTLRWYSTFNLEKPIFSMHFRFSTLFVLSSLLK